MADVRLEPIRMGHADATFRWVRDPEVADNLGLRNEPSLERTRTWIERARSDSGISAHAIVCDGVHVGNVVLDLIDRLLETCRLSIYLGEPSIRGQGVGKAAVRLASIWAFDSLGLNKVWLTVHRDNANAIRVYLQSGFIIEGVMRDEFWFRGRCLDAFRMGLLASEFRSQVSQAA
jgi:RimJ/RimL family protein N-acetyltransferase